MKINVAVTNLGQYNEGLLNYTWLTLPATMEEVAEALQIIGINEKYEEYFFSDWEAPAGAIGEYTPIEEANRIAEELDDVDEELFYALSEYYERDELIGILKKRDYILYHDCYSVEDVAREYIIETGMLDEVPECIARYFNIRQFSKDFEIENSVYYIGSGTYAVIFE